MTEIDGLDIHFIHVAPAHPNALPLIMTHGWPGSVLELLKIIGPLTDPTAHGGNAEDAFHLVHPLDARLRLLGRADRATGWDAERIARAWDVLMKRLGYTRYVAQGGDWGSVVADAMGRQAPAGPARHPRQHAGHRAAGDRDGARRRRAAPAGSPTKRRPRSSRSTTLYKKGSGYCRHDGDAPADPRLQPARFAGRPGGLVYDKFADWTYSGGEPERSLTRDEMLDDITLYWLTNTATSARGSTGRTTPTTSTPWSRRRNLDPGRR